ncbi:hypothetical protein [Streptomyces mirabilis]|uniref:hypothetical protein n=1 Tax=Streptomyces mirabilis TaxID=68239 RepID=UPI00167DF499|nr:hypothetical protein [Streptomyces mirabilis]GHD48840.1 hypothetical protein GCM10010317_026870 [Streptomyces mirabilis]
MRPDQPPVPHQQEDTRITARTSEPLPRQATAGTPEPEHGYGHVTVPLRQRGLECTVEFGLSDYIVHAVLPDGSALIISPPQEPPTGHPPGHPESWLVTRGHPDDSAIHEVIYDSEPDGPHARHRGSVPSLLAAIDARLDQLDVPARPDAASPRVSAALALSPTAQRTVPAQLPAASAVRPALPPAHPSSAPGR